MLNIAFFVLADYNIEFGVFVELNTIFSKKHKMPVLEVILKIVNTY